MGRWAGRTRVDAHFWAGRVAIIIIKKKKGLKYLFLSAPQRFLRNGFGGGATTGPHCRGHYAHPHFSVPVQLCTAFYHLSNASLICHPVPNPATTPLAGISTTAVSSAPPPCIHLQALGGLPCVLDKHVACMCCCDNHFKCGLPD